MQTLSPEAAAAVLLDKVGDVVGYGVDNRELLDLLIRAFAAAGLRLAAIPLDLPAVRDALRAVPDSLAA